ncbi:hypothetical protein HWV62_13813 [Athelia sp. TMB]|nr:hypothetical protein HWV62_13813 [Athelia sp. TMB]
MDHALSAVSFIAAACLLATLLSPLRAPHRTVYDAYIAGWLLAANLIHGINALAPTRVGALEGWCDIATNVLLAGNIAVLAACLCTAYGLACAAAEHKSEDSGLPEVKRPARYVSAALCIGLPVLSIPLHIPAQSTRFDVLENYGCQASISPSVLSIVLVLAPILFLALLVLAYAAFALHRLRTCTIQLLSCTLYAALLIPAPLYLLATQAPLGPAHPDFSAIPDVSGAWGVLVWWTVPALSLVHLVLFGAELAVARWGPKEPVPVQEEPPRKRPMIITTRDSGRDRERERKLRDTDLESFWDEDRPARSSSLLWAKRAKKELGARPETASRIALHDLSPPSSPDSSGSEAGEEEYKRAILGLVQPPPLSRASTARSAVPSSALDSRPSTAGEQEYRDTILGFVQAPTPVFSRTPTARSAVPSSPALSRAASATSKSPVLEWPQPPTAIPTASRVSFTPRSPATPSSPHSQTFFSSPVPRSPASDVPEPAFLPVEAPFDHARVPSPIPPPPAPAPKSILKKSRSERRNRRHAREASGGEGNYGLRPEDVIYMTVVQEITT